MSDEPLPETTGGHDSFPPDLAEGMDIVLREKESGSPSPLIGWLARHPQRAGRLAAFLAAEDDLMKGLPGPGAVGGGLELLGELGQGAMGVVYRARDSLGREVAVKQVQHGADLVRFRFEVEAVASLNHPNVVPVYAFGEAVGRPYLVMPLLERGSLAQRLRSLGPDRRMAPRAAATLVRGIALGAHHAHQRGLIHRDLKPGNVLLDADDTPKVTDFGLARRIEGDGMTQTGMILGTPAYMAPEQARADKVLTTAVDVWALGVILFELLTGRTPFGGDDVAAILRRVVEEPTPPVRDLRPDVPADLEKVCQRCLQKDPAARYASAQELADDLGHFLNGEPISGAQRRLLAGLLSGLGWQKETDSMPTWPALMWGAASAVFAMAWLQATVALGGPVWLAWAAIGWYLLVWVGILWGCLIAYWDRLNPVERNSTIVQFGMVLACAACLPAVTGLGTDLLRALPPFLAIKGLGVFVHGQWYWGRLYLAGLGHFAIAALMPLLPQVVWPAVFGLVSGGFQLWAALHLRHVHREAAQAR